MENNNDVSVEQTKEPSLETRFGFNKEEKSFSQKTIKCCAIASGVSLILVLLIKTPEKEIPEDSSIPVPETPQMNSHMERENFESYSAAQENERLKQKNKKAQTTVIVRLPGLQKIDRKKITAIPPGNIIKARLVTGASNGPVRAEVTESLRTQGETVIPVGATLLGVGQSTEDRLMIQFNGVLFKDGTNETIQAQAADLEDKMLGLKGAKLGRYALKYATAIGLNFVGGLTEGLQEREVLGQQVVTKTNTKNALLNGASKATIEMAHETMNNIKNAVPEIQIPKGQDILVIF